MKIGQKFCLQHKKLIMKIEITTVQLSSDSLNDGGIYLFLPVEYKVNYSNTEVWVCLSSPWKSH